MSSKSIPFSISVINTGNQFIRRPELAGLFTFTSLYLAKQESYANDELTISYRAGFPKKNCFGSFDRCSSHTSDEDDLTMSLRAGSPKGDCSPTKSMDSFSSSKGSHHNLSSLAYDRCVRAMVIAEKLTMHSGNHDDMDTFHHDKIDKDLVITAPTTGVNTAAATRRNSIDEVMILE